LVGIGKILHLDFPGELVGRRMHFIGVLVEQFLCLDLLVAIDTEVVVVLLMLVVISPLLDTVVFYDRE
jgi:hypothetical protein